MALTVSLAVMLSLFAAARRTTCRTISERHFNQLSRLEPSKFCVTGSGCGFGRCFFAVIIALYHYEKIFRQTSGCSVRCPQRIPQERALWISAEDSGLYSALNSDNAGDTLSRGFRYRSFVQRRRERSDSAIRAVRSAQELHLRDHFRRRRIDRPHS